MMDSYSLIRIHWSEYDGFSFIDQNMMDSHSLIRIWWILIHWSEYDGFLFYGQNITDSYSLIRIHWSEYDGFSFIDQNMMDSHSLIRTRQATLHYKWRVTLNYDYSKICALFLWTTKVFVIGSFRKITSDECTFLPYAGLLLNLREFKASVREKLKGE